MARDKETILQQIRATRATKPELADLDGPEAASDYSLWEDVIAHIIWLFEILVDTLKEDINKEIALNKVASIAWWHAKILEFQFHPTIPQVVEEIDFIAKYPVIDPELRIITRCSVREIDVNNRRIISVKVAKGTDELMPLNENEMKALEDYSHELRDPGISMEFVSLYADRLKLSADIYYKGQYIKDQVKLNVIAAINNYLAGLVVLELSGVVRIIELIDAMQNVEGVRDVVIHLAQGREQATPVDGLNVVVFDRIYNTSAGYIIPEDTAGHTLSDTINMIADV